MATVTTLEVLLAAYDADSSDAVTALALADSYEESGEQSASDAVRWLVRNGKRPLPHDREGRREDGDGWYGLHYLPSEVGMLPDDVSWINHDLATSGYDFFLCDADPGTLPDLLWDTLKGYLQHFEPSYYKTYRSPSLALLAFINAWNAVGGP